MEKPEQMNSQELNELLGRLSDVDDIRALLERGDWRGAREALTRRRDQLDALDLRLRAMAGAPPAPPPTPRPLSRAQILFQRWRLRRQTLFPTLGILLLLFTGWRALNRLFFAERGLTGDYHTGAGFENFVARRLDPTVDFEKISGPIENFPTTNFSVRWTGFVRVENEGFHKFYTFSDDGVRLWINDRLLIDEWEPHRPYQNMAEDEVEAGADADPARIQPAGGGMVMKLYWTPPGKKEKEILPAGNLVPADVE